MVRPLPVREIPLFGGIYCACLRVCPSWQKCRTGGFLFIISHYIWIDCPSSDKYLQFWVLIWAKWCFRSSGICPFDLYKTYYHVKKGVIACFSQTTSWFLKLFHIWVIKILYGVLWNLFIRSRCKNSFLKFKKHCSIRNTCFSNLHS